MNGRASHRSWFAFIASLALIALALGLTAISTSGCGTTADAAAGPLKVGEADNGRTYPVKVGDVIEIVLVGNPTTGFAWTAILTGGNAALVEQVGEPAYATDSTLIGAGGTYTFTFRAVNQGQALITLNYARPWEDAAPEKTFAVNLNID
jgi:inhibitor of cysteine peptidase